MPHLIKETKVEVKNGELIVSINLDLNINLNSGNITIETPKKEELKEEEEENTKWLIPDFKGIGKVNFGKSVENKE